MKFHNNNSGLAIVEATILLPFCILMVIALYYAAIFMCQKANLQANLENALMYYKNVESDTFVQAYPQMQYSNDNAGTYDGDGSNYGPTRIEDPYRFFFMKFDEASLNSFFHSMCGNMFFSTGDNVNFTAEAKNYILYKTISATATQTVKPAISLSTLGIKDTFEISVSGTVVVTDTDEFIRNTDFVIDIISDTKLGKKVNEIMKKTADFYQKFKNTLGI